VREDNTNWNEGQPPQEMKDSIWREERWQERSDWMPEHHTKNTLEVTAHCKRCQKFTQHRVDGGRQGPCIDPGHGDQSPLRDGRAGERPFRVCLIHCGQEAQLHFRTFMEALTTYNGQPESTSSIWRVDKKPPVQLR
jgi:hypothetical protein